MADFSFSQQKQNTNPTPQQQKPPSQQQAAKGAVEGVSIHSMPEQFLPAQQSGVKKKSGGKAKGKQSKWVFIAALSGGLIIVLGIIVAIIVLLQPKEETAPVVDQQPVSSEVQPPEEQLIVEEEPLPPKTIEATVRNLAGRILTRASLNIPASEQGANFTLTGRLVTENDSLIRQSAIGGEYVIRPIVTIASPLSLSITLSPEELKLAASDVAIGVWDESEKTWNILEDSFFNQDQGLVTSVLVSITTGSYAVVSPTLVEELAVDEEEPPEEEPEIVTIARSTDTDQDGLTDLEEFLYGTDPAQADTDDDSYRDGAEVLNLFSPRKPGEVRLAQEERIAIYANANHGYTLLYPSSWIASPLDEQTQNEVLFATTTDEYITLEVDQNLEQQSLVSWYSSQDLDTSIEDLQVRVYNNLDMLVSKDLTVYYVQVTGMPKIFTFTYQLDGRVSLNFLTTFEMMVKGMRVEGSTEREGSASASRDLARIASVQRIQSSLAVFYTENNSYPLKDSLTNLPLLDDGENRSLKDIMEEIPTSSLPADGTWCEEENAFRYNPTIEGGLACTASGECESFELRFCLGGDSGGLLAGVRVASPIDIQ